MRRRPNRGKGRNASKRRGTPPAVNTGRRGRRVTMPEVVTSSVELDIRRVLRYAGDCVTLDEVMDVLARWLGGRAPLAGPGAPPTASAAQPEIRRRAAVAGAALAYYRARFEAEWAAARLGAPWQPRSASSHSGAIA